MRTKLTLILLTSGMFIAGAVVTVGCTSNTSTATTHADSQVAEKSGAQLWSDNCMRCHNLRSPDSYSAAQWEVTVHHMRLRANLTGQEAQKITDFLKSAS